MNKFYGSILLIALFSLAAIAQPNTIGKATVPDKTAPIAADVAANDVAKATLAAHGGEKLKKMTSLVQKGSADLTFMGQALPGVFSTAVNGDKYYFEINSAVQSLKQVYDGRSTYSSIPGFSLPPMTSLGFPVLQRIGDNGYVITALSEDKKKKKGFRITTPEGFYTDFFVDEKTSQMKGYESAYDAGGRVVTTSVEVDEFETVEGLLIPKKYSQRFDLGQITAYANFKTKQTLVNSPMAEDSFVIPK
ncbi:MAG: hypothetical protein WBC19_00975 [Pyrinomonadaceae bacterium]|nr:hypothetical protein [Pyrinomonadaceae bacterium]